MLCNSWRRSVVSLRSRSISLSQRCLPQCEKCGQLVCNIRCSSSFGRSPNSLPSTKSPPDISSKASSYSFKPLGRSLMATKVIDFKEPVSGNFASALSPLHIHSSSSRSSSSSVISICSFRRIMFSTSVKRVCSCDGSRSRKPLWSHMISLHSFCTCLHVRKIDIDFVTSIVHGDKVTAFEEEARISVYIWSLISRGKSRKQNNAGAGDRAVVCVKTGARDTVGACTGTGSLWRIFLLRTLGFWISILKCFLLKSSQFGGEKKHGCSKWMKLGVISKETTLREEAASRQHTRSISQPPRRKIF
jgi:hypothetical protein